MPQQSQLLHYRNCTFQGQITKLNKRINSGIIITDNGQIIIGNFKNDKLSGECLIIYNPFQYCYGQFNRGLFQGWFVFQSNQKILICQFNNDKVINKQLLIYKQQGIFKIIVQKSSIYQILKEGYFDHMKDNVENLVEKQLGGKIKIEGLEQWIQEYISNNNNYNNNNNNNNINNNNNNNNNNNKNKNTTSTLPQFQIQPLPNGYKLLKYNSFSNPLSLGFIFNNKTNIIISYGTYLNNKLNGYGCKYETTTRYQGIFINGFLNGYGLKFNAGKYSYGKFQNGALVEPIYLEERSLASEQKLKQLRKINHIRNMNFINIYLPHNFISFKGISQIIFQISLKQQFISRQSNPNINSSLLTSSKLTPTKKNNNIASRLFQKQQSQQNKSIYSITQHKKIQKIDQDSFINSQLGKGFSGVNSLRKFRI